MESDQVTRTRELSKSIRCRRHLRDKMMGKCIWYINYSNATSPEKARCHSFEFEPMAIVYALRKFRTYLYGVSFKIVTRYYLHVIKENVPKDSTMGIGTAALCLSYSTSKWSIDGAC